MKIYRISQKKNRGYDTYGSAVVCAESETDAASIHPNGRTCRTTDDDDCGEWAKQSDVIVEYIGEAAKGIQRCVIVASFNAG
jgi:hypothetical protein